ncbi:hypothetical protein AVEN_152194-1 [Araneus ventricosus]|uniref:Uncharacterized protein n=1 Tax=Araneus ventricosus TaxID=182803 RepID=A0A4Y2HKV5_ARAVE|nr:hypothetical protein AVEN_152194-1 [Araneus ventricosus]
MLVDQVKKRTSADFKEHFMDEWTNFISPTKMVKKIEDYKDVRKMIKPKLPATHTKRTNKGPFKSRYENFWKKIEHPPHLKHPDEWDDYRHQKDHRQREDVRQRDRLQKKNQYNSLDKRYRLQKKNQYNSLDKRYRPHFECGSNKHFKPQCARLKSNEK